MPRLYCTDGRHEVRTTSAAPSTPSGFIVPEIPDETLGLLVHADDWPHGLRCADCRCELNDGNRYSERLTDFIDDTPAVVIVCVGCALTTNQGEEASR